MSDSLIKSGVGSELDGDGKSQGGAAGVLPVDLGVSLTSDDGGKHADASVSSSGVLGGDVNLKAEDLKFGKPSSQVLGVGGTKSGNNKRRLRLTRLGIVDSSDDLGDGATDEISKVHGFLRSDIEGITRAISAGIEDARKAGAVVGEVRDVEIEMSPYGAAIVRKFVVASVKVQGGAQ